MRSGKEPTRPSPSHHRSLHTAGSPTPSKRLIMSPNGTRANGAAGLANHSTSSSAQPSHRQRVRPPSGPQLPPAPDTTRYGTYVLRCAHPWMAARNRLRQPLPAAASSPRALDASASAAAAPAKEWHHGQQTHERWIDNATGPPLTLQAADTSDCSWPTACVCNSTNWANWLPAVLMSVATVVKASCKTPTTRR